MLFAAITIVTFNCCSENNAEEETPQTPYFEFVNSSDTAQMFPAEGGTAEIKFATSHDWTVSTDENWISLPRKSGTPSITHFTITVSQNTSTSQRTGIVTITSSNQSYEISITQEAIQIDDVAILMDDAVFISYCYANFDLNKDGKISIMEANTAKVIEIKEEPKLISVKGIEIFTNLERIYFYKCTNLRSADLGKNSKITALSKESFYGCKSLTKLIIPNSVTSIEENAFYSCSGTLIIDSQAPVKVYGGSFSEVIIGDNVTIIVAKAFANYSKLTSVTIGNSVTSIGEYAFYDCSKLSSVTIGNSVTSIGEFAFNGCYNLTSVTIPNSVTSIGNNAFRSCSSLISVTIDNSVTSIGDYAFYFCGSLTNITIPDSVTSIGDYAFEGCSSLTSVTIPDSVTLIGDYAFYRCSSLTSVTIGNSVTSIGSAAFYYCSSLQGVHCRPTTPPRGNRSMFEGNASGRKIYVPRASESAYEAANGWSSYAADIEPYDF